MNGNKDKFPTIFLFLVILVVFFIFLLNTSLSTPIGFGDEGFHSRLSQWIAENLDYPAWIPFFSTNLDKVNFARPPLFNILQASFLFVLGSHEFIIKIFTPFIAVLAGLSTFLLVTKLYNKEIGLLSSVILITLPSFVTYSVLFYNESLFVLYTTLSILLFLMAIKEDSKKYWLLSAVFAGLSFLTKHNAIIFLAILPLTLVYLLIYQRDKSKINIFRNYFIFFVIFLLVISPFLLRNIYYYQTPLCYSLPLIDTSSCNVMGFEPKYSFETRTFQGGTESSLLRFGLTNYINFAYGDWFGDNVPLKLLYKPIQPLATFITGFSGLTLSSLFLFLGAFGGLILLIKNKSHINSILLIILVTSLIVFYQARYRTEDTARHTLLWAPLIVTVAAVYWHEVSKFLNKFYKYLGIAVLVIILFIGYQNVTGKLSGIDSIKKFSPSFFEACDWVKENLPKNSMLMTFWGYRAVYNCQTNIASAYADIRLSDDPDYIVDVAKQHGITHFFIQKFSITSQPSRESYSIGFVKLLESNPDHFEKIYENGYSLEDCVNKGLCDGNIIYKVIGVST